METYYGHVRSPADAIILFEACRIGLLPRVQRRLSEKERQMIRSGSVFVWDEREAGMRRWTDGKSWSASRVSGSFLTYREMEGKRGGTTVSQPSMAARAGKTPESTRGSDDDRGDGPDDGPDGYRYKPDGLMKQSFSITTSTGQHLHLISYFSRSHPSAASLQQPSTDPNLRNVRPQKGLYPESTVNDQQNLPVVTRGPMAGAAYSIPPHPMAAYGRSAPPHPQSYPAGPSYAAPTWPPTPLHTPPTVSLHYSYPPPSNGHVAYGQPPPPPHALPPPPQAPGYPAHYERAVHPSEAAALPPTLHHSAAPIPHHSPLHVLAGRSPQLVEAHEPYERSSPREYGHGPPPPPPRMSPRTHAQHPLLSHTNGLTTAAPPARSPPLLSQPSIPPPPSLPKLGDSGSNASGVPSIGALMNGAPSVGGGLPSISAPPLTTAGRLDGPRDIPNEKIGIGGEDVRALRQLDRAAFTV